MAKCPFLKLVKSTILGVHRESIMTTRIDDDDDSIAAPTQGGQDNDGGDDNILDNSPDADESL
jgi:hypothetical protein